jgi:hypothetical protein
MPPKQTQKPTAERLQPVIVGVAAPRPPSIPRIADRLLRVRRGLTLIQAGLQAPIEASLQAAMADRAEAIENRAFSHTIGLG